MTRFRSDRYDSGQGGASIPNDNGKSYDFDRLEQVVESLVAFVEKQDRQNARLRQRVEEKNARIRTLESQLLEANQRRSDVAKRIDELVSQLDHLDGQLAGAEPQA